MKKKSKSILSIMLSMIIFLGIIAVPTQNAEAAVIGNYGANVESYGYSYAPNGYQTNNCYVYGQCTWYCCGRAYEKLGISLYRQLGNAMYWDDNVNSHHSYKVDSNPSNNSIAVWEGGNGGTTIGIGHVAFVEKYDASNNTIYISECNYYGSNNACGNTVKYSEVSINLDNGEGVQTFNTYTVYKNRKPDHYIHLTQKPIGNLNFITGSNGNGSVQVRGWAYDPNDESKSIDIEVWIGGPADSPEAELHELGATRDKRTDVAYGGNNYHGFSALIYTKKTGTQPVYVYAVGIEERAEIGSSTIEIKAPESSHFQYTVLALDTSGSMDGTPIAKQKEAATSFCETLINTSSNNYVSIITFSSSASVKCDFTNDLNALKSIINSTDASGTTNTNDALLKAGNKLQGVTDNNANKIIVLCSDGLPCQGTRKTSGKYTGNDHDVYDYANAAYDTAMELKKSYEIYTLGFFHSLTGNDLTFGQKFMSDLQNEGYYNVNDPEQLTDVFEDIAKEIIDPGTSMEKLLEKVVALLKNMFSVMLMLLQAALKAFTAATA